MSLKLEIESTEGLDESIAKLYTKQDSGKFRLEVEGVEDVTGLKNKNTQLLGELSDLKKAKKDADDAAELLRQAELSKAGNTEALRKDYDEKIRKLQEERENETGALRSQLTDLTVNATATRIAAELAVQGSADVLLPHIRSRLVMETVDGKPVVRVLGKDGKPSAASIEDLEKEIAETPAFAPLIVASRAAGAGGQGGGGGKPAAKTITRTNFDKLTDAQKSAHVREGGTVTD